MRIVIYIMVNGYHEATCFIRGTDAKGRSAWRPLCLHDEVSKGRAAAGGPLAGWVLVADRVRQGLFMVPKSPNGRSNIGSVNLDANELKFAADGSLTITMSSTEPTGAVACQLAAAPDGQFALIVRSYVPTSSILDGNYKLLNVERVAAGH